MKQSKTLYLILFLIFLVIVLVVVQVLKTPANQRGTDQGEINQISGRQQIDQQADFRIISSLYLTEYIDVTIPVKIRFSKPVALESVIYEINPKEQVTISLDPTKTEVTFEHIQAWNFNTTYTITILKSTVSLDYHPLDKDYKTTFKTVPYSGI